MMRTTDCETRPSAVADLYNRLEQENVILRAKLAMLEEKRGSDHRTISKLADAVVFENDRVKASEKEVERLRNALKKLPTNRTDTHSAFNGGHDGKECEAFHHGMDTVFNCIEMWVEAALVPAPEATKPVEGGT